MDEETKKRFPKEFSILETKNSLLKGPIGLSDNVYPVGIGLPDIYKRMEKDSLPNVEDIQNRIDVLKTEENVDQDFIEHLEEMKKVLEVQNREDSDPMEEIQGYKSVQDIVKDEQNIILNGLRQTLSKESLQMITKQIESDPGIFRTKYPELFDYMMTLED
jgi:hemerythrin-like domain-containing protein